MLLSEITPFVRYARYLNLSGNSYYNEVVGLDARLFYCINGYGKIKIPDTEYEMSTGDLLIICAGIPYHILTPEHSVNYIAINFDYSQNAARQTIPIKPVLPEEFKKCLLVDKTIVEEPVILQDVLYVKNFEALQKRLSLLVREYTQKLLYHEQKCSHLLAECIADCLRYRELGSTSLEKESSHQILAYIHEHYAENLTNHSVGQNFGYHANYVSALMKRITGMPLHRYVIHIRLMNAANLLENTNLSIGEIALACGFCDVAYFSGYFKKHFGITPSHYRNV